MKYETLKKIDAFLERILRVFISIFLKSIVLTPKAFIFILIVVVMASSPNFISKFITAWALADLTLQIGLIQKFLVLSWISSFVTCGLCTANSLSRRHKAAHSPR